MVGAGDDGWVSPTSRSDAEEVQRRSQEWEVEFARYFAPPARGTSTPPPPPGVRYVSSATDRLSGVWLPADAPAALRVSRSSRASTSPVLTVSILDVVFEEHFVSILNFSWPQFTCGAQCPGSGSRVVFVSFWDKSKQIQKFALRFPHLSDAESFLNCVKECVGDIMDIVPSGIDYICEDSSSPSEYIASNELPHRPDDASSFEEPASDHRTEAPALCYHEEPDQPVLEALLSTNIDNMISGFPLSFTEMLTNLSTANEKALLSPAENEEDVEDLHPLTGTDHPQEMDTQDTCHDVFPSTTVASNENTANKEIDTGTSTKETDTSNSTSDIMARIKRYMVDDSFHGALSTPLLVVVRKTKGKKTNPFFSAFALPLLHKVLILKPLCDALFVLPLHRILISPTCILLTLCLPISLDMLFKLERVIDELGVDFSLYS